MAKWIQFMTIVLAQLASAVPSLNVPACPSKGTIEYNTSVPEKTPFPQTEVSLCYDDSTIHIDFTARNETNFYFDASSTTNDPIYKYEVMEAFLSHGTNDPQTYLEFEISPNNITFNAFIYNPSKIRTAGAPFDTMYLQDPLRDGITAATTLARAEKTWTSSVQIPLALFNVDVGQAKGTRWRMNFFRTVVDPATFPDQWLGAWSPPDAANFHMTPFFGHVSFV
jgi:hypothetical protein